jgi:lipopolysaccharide exporter
MNSLNTGKSSNFAGDVMKISMGTVLAQILGVIIIPILTRIFSPEAFGVLAVFISITQIGEVVASLRYESSIMLPAQDEEASNQLALSLIITVVMSLLIFITLWLLRTWLVDFINMPELGPYLLLIPLAVFFAGVYNALNSWNTRTKHFGRVSVAKVINTGGTASSQLLAGLSGFSSGGFLIGGNIVGPMVSALFLGVKVWKDNSLFFIKHICIRQMIAGMKRYRKFPLLNSWSSLLNTTSLQLPSLLLATFFSPAVVGYYLLGHRVLRLPLNLIGNSIAQVFYQRASSARVVGDLSKFVYNIFSRLISLGMFPILMLTIAGQDLFIVVFGEQWAEAGTYIQILSIWTFFVFIGNPISNLTNVLEKQEAGLVFNIILITSRIVALVIGGLRGNVYLALILFSASGILSWMIYTFWLLNASGISPISFFKLILKYFAISVPFLLVVLMYKLLLDSSPFGVFLLCLSLTMLYYGIVIKLDKSIQQVIYSYGKKLAH